MRSHGPHDATGARPSPAVSQSREGLSARTRRRLLWGGVAATAIAAVGLVLAMGPDTDAPPQRFETTPAQAPETLVKVPLHADARRVAVRVIQTAVARKYLEEAWLLVGPNLRGGLTRKRWITGENPVVPFPVDELDVAPYKVDESYTTRALLEVALLPREGSGIRAQVFFLELRKLGKGDEARWVVDNWVPRASAVIPR